MDCRLSSYRCCSCSWLRLPSAFLLALVLLSGHASSNPSISPMGSSTSGTSYTLTCVASMNDITWKKGINTLSTDSSTSITVGDVTGSGSSYSRTLTFDPLLVSHGGEYTCSANSQDVMETVNVQMASPANPPVIFPPIGKSVFYSAVEYQFRCQYTFAAGVNSDPNLRVSVEVLKDGAPLVLEDNRVGLGDFQFGTQYSENVDFSPLALRDEGNYSCIVTVSAAANQQFTTNSTSKSTDYELITTKPVPVVTLSSETPDVPSHSDYNTVTVMCSDTIPTNDDIEVDKVYMWTLNGTDVSAQASNILTPDEVTSSAQLQMDLAEPGEALFACTVSISVPGDPVVSSESNLTINVLAPANPNPPVDTYSTNVTYSSAIVHWTVSSIAYTPEHYTVYYGTSQTSLTSSSSSVFSTLTNMDEYSVTLSGLTFNTLYYYRVRANNTEGEVDSEIGNFSTLQVQVPDGAPRNFTVTVVGSNSVLLRWRPVEESARNSDIVSYSVHCNSSQQLKVVSAATDIESSNSGAWYSTNITELLPYTMYTCKVQASNSAGAGPSASADVRTFEDKPGSPPTNIEVVGRSSSSVVFSWSRPDIPNGIITEYTVYIDLLNGQTRFTSVSGQVSDYTVTGLTPYMEVELGISASTLVGEGPRSSLVRGRSLEAEPGAITGLKYHVISFSRLKVNFTAPTSISVTRGVILYYVFELRLYRGDVMYSRQVEGNSSSVAIETEFTGLSEETPYNVSVYAVNSAGSGDQTSVILFTREGVPPSPTNVNATRINGSHMRVSWDPIPLTESNGFITTYTIEYSRIRSEDGRKRQSGSTTVLGNQTFVIIGGLMDSAQYSVRVSAATVIGSGESSVEQIVNNPTSASVGFFSVTIIIIIVASIGGLLLVVIVLLLLVIACKRRVGDSKSSEKDLPEKLTYPRPTDIEMGPSLAYGQIPATPEPDLDFEPFKKAPRIVTPNPTYNSSYKYTPEPNGDTNQQQVHVSGANPTYNYAYTRGTEHTYESIDHIMASKAGFESYDVPKPQLPAPRCNTINSNNTSSLSGQSDV